MIMLKMKGDRIEKMSIADPSRKIRRAILTIPGKYNSSGDNFETHPNQDQKSTMIMVDLPQGVYAGKSVTIEL